MFKQRDYNKMIIFLLFYFLSFLFTNFFALTLNFYISAKTLKLIILLRDSVPVFLLALETIQMIRNLLLKKTQLTITKLDFLVLIFTIYVIFNFFITNAPVTSRLFYLRAFIWPWLFYYLGRVLSFRIPILKKVFLPFLMAAILLYSLFSLIFWFFHLDQRNCSAIEQLSTITLKNYFAPGWCVLNNSISYDFLRFSDKPIIRLSGLILDPPISGTLLAPLVYFVYIYPIFAPFILFSFIALILTASKGGILLALTYTLLTTIILFFRQKKSRINLIRTLNIFVVFLSILIVSVAFMATGKGMFSHLYGLKQGMVSIFAKPLGTGLGTQGNFSTGVIRESYMGALLGQLGLPALFYLIILFYLLIQNINAGIKLHKYYIWAWNLFILLLLIIASMTESALAITTSSLFFFYLGLLSSPKAYKNINNNTNLAN